jgi:hypothetical protein
LSEEPSALLSSRLGADAESESESAEPIRTCVGCRARRRQAELLRFRRRPDGQVVPAILTVRGRSAYLCPSRDCFDEALRRRAFARTLAGRRGLSVGSPAPTLWGVTRDEIDEEDKRLRRSGQHSCRRASVLANLLQAMRAHNEGGA